jgi:spermidine synthase
LNLSKNGIFTVQSTSPLFAREAFWSIYKSISFEDNEFKIYPYHVYIPSFGEWGFILASRMNVDFNLFDSKIERRFIDQNVMKRSLLFSLDMSQIDVEPNRLSNHLLIKYYNDGWVKWYE